MSVIQLSLFVENKPGRISEISGRLADNGLNIRGFSVSDTADFGIVRIIVDNPELGAKVLRDAGFTVHKTPVIVINLSDDQPGGLAAVLKTIYEQDINVEYIYSLISTYLAVNVRDVERAEKLLLDTHVRLASIDEIAEV